MIMLGSLPTSEYQPEIKQSLTTTSYLDKKRLVKLERTVDHIEQYLLNRSQ